jgi:histidine ammonia-lyase
MGYFMIELSGRSLTLAQIASVAEGESHIRLSSGAREQIRGGRAVVERVLGRGEVVYGVNTGFGKLADIRVAGSELEALQVNLVRSHACGLGAPLPEQETRALMLLRANVLALGYSGCRVELVETLLQMLEASVHPLIPEKGSVGASGDLAPLAHLALSMIGEGQSVYQGKTLAGDDALSMAGIEPVRLAAKEGLAILNGTQAMAAVGGLALFRGLRVAALADLAGAMSLEALLGTPVAFDDRIHSARPHRGQLAAAAHLRDLLEDSEIRRSHLNNDPRVQDAYSLRCMPQVHGAVRGALEHGRQIVEIESGSATDNPLVFADSEEVLSGGNFHGAPLALAYDYAAIALTDLMSIAERRIDRLVNPDLNEGLPAFLSGDAGKSSGFMIAHVTAAALLNESKVFAHPASTDSVPTSGGKEDHVSMGMTSATKLRRIVENAECVLAIELLAAAEGLDCRVRRPPKRVEQTRRLLAEAEGLDRPMRSSKRIERARELIRGYSPRLVADRPLSYDIQAVARAIQGGDFDEFTL